MRTVLCPCAVPLQMFALGSGSGSPRGSPTLTKVKSQLPSGSERFRMSSLILHPPASLEPPGFTIDFSGPSVLCPRCWTEVFLLGWGMSSL